MSWSVCSHAHVMPSSELKIKKMWLLSLLLAMELIALTWLFVLPDTIVILNDQREIVDED